MGILLDLVGASPARIQGTLYALLGVVVLCLGLAGWALWERAGRFQAVDQADKVRIELTAARDQVGILVAAAKTCTRSIELAVSASQAALDASRRALEAAQGAARQHEAASLRIEDLLRTRPPANCDQAWAAIEASRKPGAAP